MSDDVYPLLHPLLVHTSSHARYNEQEKTLYKTKWYPWGIQKLVSTCEFPETQGGGLVNWGSQNSKVLSPAEISIFGGGGGGSTGVVKTQSAKSCPNFNFYPTAASTSFTDSLSHPTYLETNKNFKTVTHVTDQVKFILFTWQKCGFNRTL